MISRLLAILAALTICLSAAPRTPQAIATEVLAPLLDSVKVTTLKEDRPVNARLYRVLFSVEASLRMGGDPHKIIEAAHLAAEYAESAGAKADKQGIMWSRAKLEEFRCYTPEGMEKLKKGGSPSITQGKYSGSGIMLDYVLPRSIGPELADKFYNLEAVPAAVNLTKSDKIEKREVELARRWQRDGLLSSDGLSAVGASVKK